MKTTIKTGSRTVVVQPSPAVKGSVLVVAFPDPSFRDNEELGIVLTLNQDQIGALIFALEQAAEAAQMADRRGVPELVGDLRSMGYTTSSWGHDDQVAA